MNHAKTQQTDRCTDLDPTKTPPPIDRAKLAQAVEALLFASPEPVTLERLAKALDAEEPEVYQALIDLRTSYAQDKGIAIVRVAGGYQMCTNPEFAPYVSRFLAASPTKLSRAALETLSIVAYRQPITLPELEAIRGVDCSGVVRTLVERGLIEEAGRKDTVGRPVIYVTTERFLAYFGLHDLSELPSLEELARHQQPADTQQP
jgi:segregation and condensation protein B